MNDYSKAVQVLCKADNWMCVRIVSELAESNPKALIDAYEKVEAYDRAAIETVKEKK